MRHPSAVLLTLLLACSIAHAQATEPISNAALTKSAAAIRAQKFDTKKEMDAALAALLKPGMTIEQAKIVFPIWTPPPAPPTTAPAKIQPDPLGTPAPTYFGPLEVSMGGPTTYTYLVDAENQITINEHSAKGIPGTDAEKIIDKITISARK